MKNASRWVGAVLVCVILLGACQAFAQDWPQWRGPNRDGKVADFTAPATWPKALKQGWKTTVGLSDCGPALVGDRVYVFARQGGDEVTLCLDAKDGNEVWRDKYAAAAISGADARGHAGPRSTPTVADGKVITLGVNGVLSCLDAKDGKLVWRKEDIKGTPRFHTSSSPIVVDGLVIAQLGGGDGAVYAFDLAKGEEKWKAAGQSPAYASPVLLTVDGVKQIVTLTDKGVVGIGAADGKPLWQIAFAPTGMAYNAATPIVDGDTVIYTGQGRGTHAVKVEKKGDAFAATEIWKSDVGVQFNTPVLKDGMLYGLSDKGKLFCLNAKDGGKTVWEDGGGHKNYAGILDAGTALLALPENGEMIVYKPGEKFEELAKIKVGGAATYGLPVVCGKRILVKDQDSLTMWTLE